MVLEPTRYPTATENEVCVCGRRIADGQWYYGFPLDPDNDEPMAFIDPWHDHCLGEWGYVLDFDEPLWVRHRDDYCVEQSDEDIRAA